MSKVKITTDLRDRLGVEASRTLIDEFKEWKNGGEYDHFTFGKESGFYHPKSAREENLRHVHLIPIIDQSAREHWVRRFATRSRKTSNRVLVYAEGFIDPRHYLLIDIFNEPRAHELMKNPVLMESLADIASRFRETH